LQRTEAAFERSLVSAKVLIKEATPGVHTAKARPLLPAALLKN
jgi:hypothetical protein